TEQRTARRGYDPAGRVTWEQDPAGSVTASGYDPLGRLTSVTRAAGTASASTTTYAYDAADNRVGQTAGQGGPGYGKPAGAPYADARLTRLTLTTDGAGTEQRQAGRGYDRAGRLTAATDGNRNLTTTGYDVLGRVVGVTRGANVPGLQSTTTYRYDA